MLACMGEQMTHAGVWTRAPPHNVPFRLQHQPAMGTQGAAELVKKQWGGGGDISELEVEPFHR